MNLYKITLLIETPDTEDPTDWIMETIEEGLDDPTQLRSCTTVNMDPEIWG